jgi:hypothetical protein
MRNKSQWTASIAVLCFAVLALLIAPTFLVATPSAPPRLSPASGVQASSSGLVLRDDATLYANTSEVGPIRDTVQPGLVGLTVRSYTIGVRVAVADSASSVLLMSDPLVDWSSPSQLPGGPDALPPLSEWNWTVTLGGLSDTSNWQLGGVPPMIHRVTAWENASYVVTGTFVGQESVTVNPNTPDGTTPTSLALSLNGWSPGSPSGPASPATSAATTLHPTLLRFGMTSDGIPVSWNETSGAPLFGFSHFDATIASIDSLGGSPIVSLPVGTWGDGNALPAGMPVNQSMPVPFGGSVGYFAAPGAYASYVAAVAAHAASMGETVTYWEVGNEVPLVNVTEVARFAQLITIAAKEIHRWMPNALVSADTITSRHYLPEFATDTVGVGFLSFHDYSSNTICSANGSYCAPGTFGQGATDAQLIAQITNTTVGGSLPPVTAQAEWYALTGLHLPVLDTETNLNSAGGGGMTSALGSDPRIQTLFGAAWLGASIIQASHENLSSLNYFRFTNQVSANGTVTSPFGGFGLGLTSIEPNGSLLRFAPYWAFDLWTTLVPALGSGVVTEVTGSSDVIVYAVREGANLSVVLVNPLAVTENTSVRFTGPGVWHPSNLTVLDSRGYGESYSPVLHATSVVRSGVLELPAPAPGKPVTIEGYGMAVLCGSYSPRHSGGGNSSGNGTGNGTGNSSGNGTGNGTGNSSGNGTGNSSGNGTGNSSGNGTGNSSGNGTGNSSGNGTGNSSGNGTGNSSGNGTGNSSGNGTGNSSGNGTGNSSGNGTGNSSGNGTGNSSGNGTGNSSGGGSGSVNDRNSSGEPTRTPVPGPVQNGPAHPLPTTRGRDGYRGNPRPAAGAIVPAVVDGSVRASPGVWSAVCLLGVVLGFIAAIWRSTAPWNSERKR